MSAPASARESAIAWPMPLEAPVTTAPRPLRSKGDGGVRRGRLSEGPRADATSGPDPIQRRRLRLERGRPPRGEHELEGASARGGGGAVAGAPKPGPLVELLRGLVRLLHEQDDRVEPRSPSIARPPGSGPGNSTAASGWVDPHRDQLHLERVDTCERADDAEPSSASSATNSVFCSPIAASRDPVAPRRSGSRTMSS